MAVPQRDNFDGFGKEPIQLNKVRTDFNEMVAPATA